MNDRAEKLKALALETAIAVSATAPTAEDIAEITPIIDKACEALVKAFDILMGKTP